MHVGKVLKEKGERCGEPEVGRKVARKVITLGGFLRPVFIFPKSLTALHGSYWRLFSQILCRVCVCVFKPVQENTLLSWEEGMMFPKAKQ